MHKRKQKQQLKSTISSLLCQSSMRVRESTTVHTCDAADAGAAVLFLFSLHTSFLMFHKIIVEPLMSHKLF